MTSMKHNWTYRVHAHKPYRRRRKEVPGIIWILAAAIVMVIVGLAKGAVVYDTVSEGYGPDFDDRGTYLGYWNQGGAQSFTPPFTVRLTDIEVALNTDGPFETITLFDDVFGSGTFVPNEILGSWEIQDVQSYPLGYRPASVGIAHVSVNDDLILAAGERYWISLGGDVEWRKPIPFLWDGNWVNGSQDYGWIDTYSQPSRGMLRVEGDHIGDFDGDGRVSFADFSVFANNFTGSASAVSASAIPEPASILLVFAGAICIWRRR